MKTHVMHMTPVDDSIMMNKPIIKWHKATRKWPPKSRVLLPANLTVHMLTNEAKKFTAAIK